MLSETKILSHSGSSVRLVRATVEDADRTFKALVPESAQNLAFFTSRFSLSRQKSYLEKMVLSPTDMLFIVERVEDGACVGAAGLREFDDQNRNARLGAMVFDPANRGHGYNTEATYIILDHAFQSLGLHKIYVRLLEGNEKALSKYLRMGFTVESNFREEYLLNGKYLDMVGLSLLDREWQPLGPGL